MATTTLAWMQRNADAVMSAWQRPMIQATDAFFAFDRRQLEMGWALKLAGDEGQANIWLQEGIDILSEADPDLVPESQAYQLITLAQILALQGDPAGGINAAREAIHVFPLADDRWEAAHIYFDAWRAIAMASERWKISVS